MDVEREIVVECLVLLHRLEQLGSALDVLLDRGNSQHVPVSWLTHKSTRVRVALEDALSAAPPD